MGRIFNALTMLTLQIRQLHESERYLALGLPYCHERGLDTWRLYLLACRAQLQLDYGHWEEAADVAASVLRDPHHAS